MEDDPGKRKNQRLALRYKGAYVPVVSECFALYSVKGESFI